MSIKLYHQARRLNIPFREKAVLKDLAIYAKDDGTSAYPSQADLVEGSSLSPRSVRGALATLKASKAILEDGRTGKTGQIVVWKLNTDLLSNPAGVAALEAAVRAALKAADSAQKAANIVDKAANIVDKAAAAAYVKSDSSDSNGKGACGSAVTHAPDGTPFQDSRMSSHPAAPAPSGARGHSGGGWRD